MKRKLTYMITGIMTMLIFSAGSVFAFGSCLAHLDMMKGITLTDAQKTKLQTSEIEHRKKMIRLHSDMAIANVEKEALMKDKNFKKDAIEKQIHKIMAIKTDIEMEKLSEINELRTILTDDQWKVFVDHMGAREMGGRGRMMGMGMMCERNNCPPMGGMEMNGGHGMGMGMRNCPRMHGDDGAKE